MASNHKPEEKPTGFKGYKTLEEYEAALRKTGGLVSATAQLLGVTPGAVTRRVKRSKKLQKVQREVRAQVTDLAESKLIAAIEKGQAWAVCFWLKTQAKDRGYNEKGGPDIPPGTKEAVKIEWVDPPNFQIPEDRRDEKVDVNGLDLGACTLEDLGLEGNGAANGESNGGRVKGNGNAGD